MRSEVWTHIGSALGGVRRGRGLQRRLARGRRPLPACPALRQVAARSAEPLALPRFPGHLWRAALSAWAGTVLAVHPEAVVQV